MDKSIAVSTETKSASSGAAGILLGMAAALAFSTNPLFAKTLYQQGFSVDSVLLFRFLPAAAGLGAWLALRGKSLRLAWKELCFCVAAGLLFCTTSIALFQSYSMMDVGVAATLLFVYPVLVTFISAIFFREKIALQTIAALVLAVIGVALLSATPHKTATGVLGICLALLSAFSYAGYLVLVGMNKKFRIDSAKLTFYVLATCVVFYAVKIPCSSFQLGNFSAFSWLNIAGLSVISAGISLGCATLALKRCSTTVVAVLGALEPLAATFWGIMVFQESMNFQIALGMLLILFSVLVVVFPSGKKKRLD